MTLVNAETGEIVRRLPVHATRYSGLVHPAADRYPRMKDDRLAELAVDIAEHGLIEPIWIDVEGMLLDGRNRLAACQMVGVEPEFAVYEGEDVEAFIVSKNEHRRHLSVKEQRELRQRRIAELREQGMSTRAIADEVGVSGVQVLSDLAPEASSSPDCVIGKDGKRYPTSQRKWSTRDALTFIEAWESATPSGKVLLANGYGLTTRSAESTAARLRKKLGVSAKTGPAAAAEKRERIKELASGPLSSDQIGKEVGLSGISVREYARAMGVEIAADAIVSKTRRLNADRVIQALVDKASYDIASDSTLDAIDFAELDRGLLADWVSSLTASITSLTKLRNRLQKELTRG